MGEIEIRRIYEKDQTEAYRILVDRIWPRGISKKEANWDLWFKEIGPSHELRKWFAHDPEKFAEFCIRYHKELDEKAPIVNQLVELAKDRKVVLLYSSKDEAHNQAKALLLYLEKRLGS